MYSAWKKNQKPVELDSTTNPIHRNVAVINFEKAQEHHKKATAYEYIHYYPAAEIEWFETNFFYTRALEDAHLESSKKNIAMLGVIRCLIKQRSYEAAFKKLDEYSHELKDTSAEYYLLTAMTLRYQRKYDLAYNAITLAYSLTNNLSPLHPLEQEIAKERQLQEDEFFVHMRNGGNAQEYVEQRYNHTAYQNAVKPSRLDGFYNIISIDGGGLRGIIPILQLCEIELKTQQPISNLVDAIAGTSTGAIIACGLSVPSPETGHMYSAWKLLELYLKKAPEIFKLNPSWTRTVLGESSTLAGEAKYTDAGRKTLFAHYFGEKRLKDAQIDLIVPAVGGVELSNTVTFSRQKAQQSESENYRIIDILMATSAAPGMFPTYSFTPPENTKYRYPFVDGGVTANHPAQLAYDFATTEKNIPAHKVFMWSLGTGMDVLPHIEGISHSTAKNFTKNILQLQQKSIENTIRSNGSFRGKAESYYARTQISHDNLGRWDNSERQNIDQLLEYAIIHMKEAEIFETFHNVATIAERLVRSPILEVSQDKSPYSMHIDRSSADVLIRENPVLSPFASSESTETSNNNDTQIPIEDSTQTDIVSLQTIFSSNIHMLCTRLHLDTHFICDETLSERRQLQLLTETLRAKKHYIDTWLVSLKKQVEAIERVSQSVTNTDLNTSLTTDSMSNASTPISSPTRISPSSSNTSNSPL